MTDNGPTAWDDERLAAAFGARDARVVVPPDLASATVARLRDETRPTSGGWSWHRLVPAGAALAVVVVGVTVAAGMLRIGRTALESGSVAFRDGPSAELRTLDAGRFALDFPVDWHGYDATGPFQGTALAVVSNIPIPCGGDEHLDITCVYERPLAPGEARLIVGQEPYRGSTIFDRPDIENGISARITLGDMPAIQDTIDVLPGVDFYAADTHVRWSIATPESLSRVVVLEANFREPGVTEARTATDAILASFRFTPPPTPLPDDPVAAAAAARRALDAHAASFRQGYVPAEDGGATTYLDCLPLEPNVEQASEIQFGAGGALGGNVPVVCRWTVTPDGPFWQITMTFDWSIDPLANGWEVGGPGQYRETLWIDAASTIVGTTFSGDPLPAREEGPTPTPDPAATPEPAAPGWAPWPPDEATVVDLPTNDDRIPRVAVVDRSGTLTGVRAPTAEDGSPEGPSEGFYRDPTDATQLRLRWETTICDREMLLAIHEDLDRIVIEHAPRQGCDAMAVGRELIFEFSRDVDPGDILVEVIPAELLPEVPAQEIPDALFGMDVINVEQALAIRALQDDDQEIAISGWLSRTTVDCLIFERTAMEELFFGQGCSSDGLMASQGHGLEGAPLPLALGEIAVDQALPYGARVPVVLIGHFDDRRSAACRTDLAKQCADRFWVDGVWMDGTASRLDGVDLVRGGSPAIHTHDEAWARVRGPSDDPLIPLSVSASATLSSLEPATARVIPAEMWNWHVTAYEPSSGRVRTFVIPDTLLADEDGVIFYEIIGSEIEVTTRIID